jgi:DNA-binding response OmpR family regulator
MRIIFIDDEEELISTLSERLSFRGIVSDWTNSPDTALKMISDTQYDIAVVDVKMPGIDGFQMKKMIEEIDQNICFIFLTGHASENNFIKGCNEAGEKYYLVKPVNIDYLISLLNQLMEEKGKRNEQ